MKRLKEIYREEHEKAGTSEKKWDGEEGGREEKSNHKVKPYCSWVRNTAQ